MPKPIKNFLIIQTSFIGDVVLSLPVAQILKKHYPESQIHFLLRKGNENLLENHPAIDTVWIWNKKQKKYSSLIKLILELRKNYWDAVINLHRFLNTGLVTMFLKSELKIGFDSNPLSFTYDNKIEHQIPDIVDDHNRHEVERNLSLLSPLSINDFERPKLYPSEEDFSSVKNYISGEYLVFAPSSVWFTKQWPQSKWVKLIKLIPEQLSIYFIGAGSDFEFCKDISAHHPSTVNLCGQLTFLQSSALIKNSLVTVVNDSAPLHFATAMNSPTIAIFCSTSPAFGFYPLSDQSEIVEYEGSLYCRPCGLHGYKSCPEGHFKCALDISSEKVYNAIKNLLPQTLPDLP